MITFRTSTNQTGIRQRSLRKHCRLGRATELVFVMATGAMVIVAGANVQADTLTWNGGGGAAGSPVGGPGTWDSEDTNNWDNGAAADVWQDDDDAIFTNAAPVAAYTVTVDNTGAGGVVIANTLTFNADNVTIAGDALTINTSISFGAAVNDINLSAATNGGYELATATGAQTLNVTGAVTGAIENASAGTLDISGGTNSSVTNSSTGNVGVSSAVGSIDNSGAGTSTVASGGSASATSLVSNGLLENTADGSLAGVTASGGTFTQSGATASAGAVVNSGGIVNLDNGTASSLENTAAAGITTVTDGAVTGTTMIAGGSVVVNQTTADAAEELQGNISITGGALTVTNGDVDDVTVNDSVADAGAADFTLTAGTADSLDNQSGESSLNGGTVSGDIDVSGGIVTVDGSVANGTNTVTGGTLDFISGTLTNGVTVDGAGATFELSSGAVNSITLTEGTVEVQDGTTTQNFNLGSNDTLNVTGTGSVGTVAVNGGTLSISNGTSGNVAHNSGTNTVVSGAGQIDGTLTVTGGDVIINAGVDANDEVTGETDVTGGSLTVTQGDLGDVVQVNDAGADGNATDFTLTAGSITALDHDAGESLLDGGTVTGNIGVADGTVTVTDGVVSGTTTILGGAVIVNETTNDAAEELQGNIVVSAGSLTVTSGDVDDVTVNDGGADGGAADFTLTVGTADSLTNQDGESSLNGGTVTGDIDVSGGTVTVNGSVANGTNTVTGGTLDFLSGTLTNGVTVNGSGATFELSTGTVNSITLTEGTVEVQNGTTTQNFTLDANDTLNVTGTGSVGTVEVNGGTLSISNGTSGNVTHNSGTNTIVSGDGQIAGTLSVTGGDATIDANVDANDEVTGATDVTGGSLTVTQGDLAAVQVNDTGADGGATDFTLTAGSIDSLDHDAGETQLDGGTVSGNVDVAGGTVTVDGATTSGANTVTDGTLDFISGTLTNGVTVNGSGATFELSSGTVNSITLTEGTVEVQDGTTTQNFTLDGNDTLNVTGSGSVGTVAVNGGNLAISDGTSGNVTHNSGSNTVVSGDGQIAGTLTVNGGAVTINANDDANDEVTGATTVNGGSLTVAEGDLTSVQVNDGGADGGATDFTLAAGSIDSLDHDAGQTLLDGGTVGTTVDVAAGTVTIDGATVLGATTVTGGSLAVTGGDLAAVQVSDAGADGGATDFTLSAGSVDSLDHVTGETLISGGTVDGNSTAADGTVTITEGVIDGALAISGADVAITETADAADEITGTTTITGGSLTINEGDVAAVVVNDGAADGTDDLTLNSGSIASLDQQAGETQLNGGTVGGDITVSGGTVTNAGVALSDVNTAAAGTFVMDGGSVDDVDNAGTFELSTSQTVGGVLDNQAGGTVDASGAGGDITLTVTGTGAGASATTFTTGGDIDSNGANTVTIVAGNILIEDGATFDGTDDLGANVQLDGAITNQADIDLVGDTVLSGGLTNEGNLEVSAQIDAAGNDIASSGAGASLTLQFTGPGSLINGGDVTVSDGAGFSVADNATATVNSVTSTGEGSSLSVVGTLITAAGVTNTDGAQMVVNGSGDGEGQVTGTITNDADLNIITADINGALDNNVGTERGDIDVTGGTSTVSGAVTNAGDFTIAGGAQLTLDGASNVFTNEPGGTLVVTGAGSVLEGNVFNQSPGTATSEVRVEGSSDIDGNLTNGSGATTTVSTASGVGIDGLVTNNGGDLNLVSGTLGSLDNNNAGGVRGDVDVTGNVSVDNAFNGGTLTNAGDLAVSSGTLTLSTGNFTNEGGGVATIFAGSTLSSNASSGQFINTENGQLNLGGTITSWVDNQAGSTLTTLGTSATISGSGPGGFGLINNGTLNIGDGTALSVANGVDSNTALSIFGTLNGNVDSSAALSVVGTLNGAVASSAPVSVTGTLNGSLVNSSTTTLGGGVITGDVATGSNFVVTSAGGSVLGDLAINSGGNLDLTASGASLSVGSASINDTLTFDSSVTSLDSGLGLINSSGAVDGSISLVFENPGSVADGTVLISASDLSGLTIDTLTGAEQAGFDFFVDIQDNGTAPDTATLEQVVGASVSGAAASVGITETIIGAIVNRPTSPFVTDLATDPGDNPCGPGVWARITGGEADGEGNYVDVTNNFESAAPVDLTYGGLQVGGDFACFGGQANGWDLAYGLIGGFNIGDTVSRDFGITGSGPLQNTTETDFTQTYFGGYVTAARGRLVGDLQVRYEDTDFTANDSPEIDPVTGEALSDDLFNDTEFSNDSITVSGSVGYSWPIQQVQGLLVASSVGFSITHTETDVILLENDLGSIQLDDHTQQLGFISGTVARSMPLPGDISRISYFATGTYYNDFADDREATFDSTEFGLNELELATVDSYGEISLGLNYLQLLIPGELGNSRQLNAAVRADYRFGEEVDSWGVTAQVRVQF